jgi:hypothetical protein
VNRFFARLAERAAGSFEGLQRRQPALFEPEAPAVGGRAPVPSPLNRKTETDAGFEELESEVEVTARPSPAATPSRRRSGQRSRRANALEISSEPDFSAAPQGVAEDSSIAETLDHRPPSARRLSATHSRRMEPAISADAPTEQVRTDSTEVRISERDVTDRDAKIVIERAPNDSARPPHREVTATEAAAIAEPRGVLARREESSGRAAQSDNRAPEKADAPERHDESAYALTLRSQTETGRLRPWADSPQSAQTGEQAPAPIYVTIGRVEVRAVLPAGPPPRPRRQPPPSLDEFLRRRGRGPA